MPICRWDGTAPLSSSLLPLPTPPHLWALGTKGTHTSRNCSGGYLQSMSPELPQRALHSQGAGLWSSQKTWADFSSPSTEMGNGFEPLVLSLKLAGPSVGAW